MGITAREIFYNDSTWTPQPGTGRAWVSTVPLYQPQAQASTPNGMHIIDSAGALWYSGSNIQGIGGVGTVTAVSSPTAVVGGLVWRSVMAYNLVMFGLDSQFRMYSWGFNLNGNLGIGSVATVSSPTAVAGGLKWRQLCYVEHSSVGTQQFNTGVAFGGIDAMGAAWTWGANNVGQLATNVAGGMTSSPVQVVGGKTWLWMSMGTIGYTGTGGGITALVDSTGQGWMCGQLNGGAGGNGTLNQVVSSPVAVIGGTNFQIVIPGAFASNGTSGPGVFAFTQNNQMLFWGSNANGCSGTGQSPATTPNILVPAIVGNVGSNNLYLQFLATPGTWATSDGGETNGNTVYAIASDFTLYAWGKNTLGMLGTGDNLDYSSPVAVVGGLKWSQVWVAEATVYGITTAGDMYAWGSNINGQVGNGVSPATTASYSSPQLVSGGFKWAYGFGQVTGSSTTQFAIGVDLAGRAYGWGYNANGQLGNGTVTTVSTPTIMAGAKQWSVLPFSGYSVGQGIDVNVNASYPIMVSKQNAWFAGLPPLGPAQAVVVEYEQ